MVVLTALEKQYCHLTQVEVDEVARLVGHVRSEIASHDAVPRRIVLLVELLLYIRRYVLQTKTNKKQHRNETKSIFTAYLFNIILFDRLRGAVHCVLLHVFAHVGVLDHCLAVCHLGGF